MGKNLIVLSDWTSKSDYQRLKTEVEENIPTGASFSYLFCIQKAKDVEELPHIPKVYYVSKKDFSLFGKLKNLQLQKILQNRDSGILIGTSELNTSLYKRVMKNTQLISIGIESKNPPDFSISFKNADLKNGDFYKKINNYLTKIQL